MIEHALGLFLTIVLLTFLLVGIGINSAWHWGFKAAVIMLSAGVMIACYFSLMGLLGWPTPFNIGEQDLVLIHAVIEEPGKSGEEEGRIYLWARSNQKGSAPLALQFPYRRDLHQSVSDALEKKQGGTSQGVRVAGGGRGKSRNESFNVFDLHKPGLTDKGPPEY